MLKEFLPFDSLLFLDCLAHPSTGRISMVVGDIGVLPLFLICENICGLV